MKAKYNHQIPLLEVFNPELGGYYHLVWANNGCIWVLQTMNKDRNECVLKTSKTDKIIKAKLTDLRHTRGSQFKIEKIK